ncbi:MAG: heme ABC exporter ATP-binding protein CcmA [Salinarimonas sp.]|nr:heme ABC exporter ATP-binding protein CcmA [Salinarimonas sp.]
MRLIARGLACRRSGRLIFSGLDFDLRPGDALLVTGRNGAGKSTLLAILAGRLRAAAGDVALEGAGEATLPERLHWIAHRDGLKTALTARENLAFAAAMLGDARLAPGEALERVGLPHVAEMPVAYLSAGQRRRVALARLLVAHRPIWLLDEPTSALDAASQEMLHDLMRAHRAAGGIIIAATHLPLPLDEAQSLAIAPPAPEQSAAGSEDDPGDGWDDWDMWDDRPGQAAPAPAAGRPFP